MADLCKHCNLPESEHHAFEAVEATLIWPAGCVCNREYYLAPPQPICDEYTRSPFERNETYCAICEHDKACHAGKD